MPPTCPRCHRKLADSAEAEARPVFCMYCGHRLRTEEVAAPAALLPDPAQTVDAPTAAFGGDPTPEVDRPVHRTESIPEQVGGFRLLQFIGAGGMGAVYEAEAVESGQRVAVKLLSGRLASNPASVERFRQEGRVASQISHPHCVFVFRADADAGRPYIVMELMPGRTLKDLVDQQGPLPVTEAITRILDVIAGLAEAHRLGVIHRDVKPSNCFLTDDNRVKVGDFGLSKSLAAEGSDRQITQSGAFLGTVLFASPEQIRGEPVSYDSDVYAVCGTLYFLLAGRAPYQHESLTAALAKAVSEPPPPLRPRRPDVPVELERVILRGLDRDRDRRWQSLEELGDALRELLPKNQRPARPRSLILAYLVDAVILELAIFVVEVLRQFIPGLRPLQLGVLELTWPGLIVTFLYFSLSEGIAGWTPGKRLLRLRVARLGETGPPGLLRAVVRTATFQAMWLTMSQLPDWFLDWPGGATGGGLGLIAFVLGLAALLVQFRRTTHGNRGLHDFASGCRVIERPRPPHRVRLVSRYPCPLDRVQPSRDRLPATVGGFTIKGKVSDLPDAGEVWLAEDRSLGRRVLVRICPPGTEDPIGAEDPVNRPGRLRVIGHGEFAWQGASRGWVAYVAPTGAPLLDVVDPKQPLSWADTRPLLEQLTDELAAAEEEGHSLWRPTIEQVWVEPGGRLQLLDFPLPCLRPEGDKGEKRRSRTGESHGPGSHSTPLTFVRQVASLALEGRPRERGGQIRAPLPPHASKITDRLFAERAAGYSGVGPLRVDLKENHTQPPMVTAGMRAAHIGAQSAMLATGLIVMFAACGLFSLMLAVGGANQERLSEAVRDMVADPQQRALLQQRVEQIPADLPMRQRLERALAADQAATTVAQLTTFTERRRNEAAAQARYLTRPEKVVLDRVKAEADTDFLASEMPLALIDTEIQLAQVPTSPFDRPGQLRAATFLFFVLVTLMWPVGWAVFAWLFRGGLALRLAGITLVRADGRPVGRFRCAARELLVWLPLTTVLLATLWFQLTGPEWISVRVALWLTAGLLLPVYVMIALRYPAQPPQDRILGTYLVPV